MSSPQELHINFIHQAVDYDVKLVKDGKSDNSVKINGAVYAVLGDKGKLQAATEILNSLSLDSIANAEELKGKLALQRDISFPQPQTPVEVFKKKFKSTGDFFQGVPKEMQEMSQLIHLVKNIKSDDDIKAVFSKLLALHNNHPDLALDHLKEVFRLAGRGPLSTKVADMLTRDASNRNVDEIRAFGRGRTVDVVSFLKALPQTKEGSIDLTQMEKIGEGGTQDVYALKDTSSRSFVIKVIRASLNLKDTERLEKYTVDKVAYQVLHDGFGEHCTVEQLLLRNIDDGIFPKEALISVAAFEAGYKNESKIGLNAPFFEWDATTIIKNINNNSYADFIKSIKSLFTSGAEGDFDLKLLKRNLTNSGFAKMADLIENDPDFCNAIKIFLSKFKEYFSKSGQYLDIAGLDNIIFFKDKDNKWVFKLGTVIKRETAQKFSDELEKIQTKQDFDGNMAYSCFHWTKTLNMLGMMAGMGKIIDDNNVKKIASMWNELELARVTRTPVNPIQILNVLETLENNPAEGLFEKLQRLDASSVKWTQGDAHILVEILLKLPQDKKLILARYLDSLLPKAGDSKPDCEFCPIRFRMGMELKDIKEGKELALSLFKDVMLDPHPNAPREVVKKAIDKLLE